jgi:putative SOS response-associated peptidase YedK
VKDPSDVRATLFNARSETAAEKPSFREALRRKRCVVPVSGFYEWRREGDRKEPYHVVRSDGAPLLLAGIYAERRDLNSVAVLTCAPNERMADAPRPHAGRARPSRPRPVARSRRDADRRATSPISWGLPRASGCNAYPVDPRVGNARIDDPWCRPSTG